MNKSAEINNDVSTASMYLSFDAESTMSSVSYKTVDIASDMSMLDIDDALETSVHEAHNVNSTLEAIENSNISQLQTVKKLDPLNEMKLSPLRTSHKNIMKEYTALSSTPSREQIFRSVDIVRGSEVDKDLELAFLNIEEEKKNSFITKQHLTDENKENAQPDCDDISGLSVSSGETINSVIETKIMVSVNGEKFNSESEDKVVDTNEEDLEATPKAINEEENGINGIPIAKDESDNSDNAKLGQKVLPFDCIARPKHVKLVSRSVRKTLCEPDLRTNRPSRIGTIPSKKRFSTSANNKNPDISGDIVPGIPELLNKMFKISSLVEDNKIGNNGPSNIQKTNVVTSKSRSSLLPTVQTEKRAFNLTQRMSIVVKTTLNSPARKIPRKSVIPNPIMRRSVLPIKNGSTMETNIARKSMLPTSKITKIGTDKLNPIIDEPVKIKEKMKIKEKSLGPLQKVVSPQQSQIFGKNLKTGVINSKSDAMFSCLTCGSKFSIKSLLDAHKRSHEYDTQPDSVVKKSFTKVAPVALTIASTNQCKFCDKKFALTRALHIHLMQHCPKIPPCEKRKLTYTEMNHVEKAQLPVFNNVHAANGGSASADCNFKISSKMALKFKSNLSNSPMRHTESLFEKKEKTIECEKMPPPPSGLPRIKIKGPHAGISRTPNKGVPCYLCKQTFQSVIDYTNHCMTMHSMGDNN